MPYSGPKREQLVNARVPRSACIGIITPAIANCATRVCTECVQVVYGVCTAVFGIFAPLISGHGHRGSVVKG